MSSSTKLGHGLAKALGIKLHEREPYQDDVTRGESVFSVATTETYIEQQPTTAEFIQHYIPTGDEVLAYIVSLFPFLSWIGHYNLQWLIGDLVAGITIGGVVVPQGMAYAQLANLDVQFGLYSSFMGVLLYWFFATSKDITIGPVAVMSQVTGSVVYDLGVLGKGPLSDVPNHFIASGLAILAGSIVMFLGLTRLGWIVDLISLTALSAFMTGSALNIAVGQVPTLMGYSSFFNTRDATYMVFINSLRTLPRTTLDAAVGLTALFLLYAIRWACNYSARRWKQHQRTFFFLSTLRTVFVILLYILVSYLANRDQPKGKYKFKILQDVPRGFQNAAVPQLDKRIAQNLVSYLPSSTIVLLIEHIAISKSFGRVNNYIINPSQEMVAIGVTNLLGPFLGAYAATGSFSRTAIKSKAGVRTPFAGVITAIVVLLAIYALPAMFYWIPNAALAAVIIHAVGDLITPPNTVYQFWRVNPFEVLIYFVGVIVTVFTTIENGIYCTICISAAMLLYRLMRTQGRFLGKVKVHSVLGDQVIGDNSAAGRPSGDYGTFAGKTASSEVASRSVFLPLDHGDGSNPALDVEMPYPGVFIYRFAEGFAYPNASHSLEFLTDFIFKNTRRTNLSHYPRPGDRPWNEPGPSRWEVRRARQKGLDAGAVGQNLHLPTLKAVILDFSSVNNVDVTSVQTLIDVRNQLDRYTSPETVDWHFANVNNRWAKRGLISAGFGYPSERSADGSYSRWKPIFSVAEIGGDQSAAADAQARLNEKEGRGSTASAAAGGGRRSPVDIEAVPVPSEGGSSDGDDKAKAAGVGATTTTREPRVSARAVAVSGINRPLFHIDLVSALQSAIHNVEARGEAEHEDEPVKSV